MLWLWSLVLIAVFAVFVFLLKFALTRVGALVGRQTYERHTAAENILATGRIPESWRLPAGRNGSADQAAESRVYLRRLDDLINYFGRAPVFDEEPTRQILLEELRAARSRWERGIWEIPEGEPSGTVSPTPPPA